MTARDSTGSARRNIAGVARVCPEVYRLPRKRQKLDIEQIKVSCQHCTLADLCLPGGMDEKDLEKLDEGILTVDKKLITIRKQEPLGAMVDACVKHSLASSM